MGPPPPPPREGEGPSFGDVPPGGWGDRGRLWRTVHGAAGRWGRGELSHGKACASPTAAGHRLVILGLDPPEMFGCPPPPNLHHKICPEGKNDIYQRGANIEVRIECMNLFWPLPPPPPPLFVTFRRVVAPSRGLGQSPVLPFACCVGSLDGLASRG